MPEQVYLTRRERREAIGRATEPSTLTPATPEPPALDLELLREYTKRLAEERAAASHHTPSADAVQAPVAPIITTEPARPEREQLGSLASVEIVPLILPSTPLSEFERDGIQGDPSAKPDTASSRARRHHKPKSERAKRPWWRHLVDFIAIMLAAALLVVIFKTFVFRMFFVPSASMEPTLQINDHLVTELVSSRFDGYHSGDIVVFRDPDNWLGNDAGDEELNVLQILGILPESRGYLVKRIIGEPGDHVEGLADGTILINGRPLPEEYAALPAAQEPFTATVSAGHYWMMGDNRGNSTDSRFHGEVAETDFVGKVVFRLMPLDRFGPVG